jgi:2-hydroxy-6-oxonona-2,4-dienedioate hydrolase
MKPQSFSTRVHGLGIHCELAGDLASEPVPVVLLHGLGVSSRYFRPLAERLARDRLVLSPDLPGTGRSDDPRHTLGVRELSDTLETWLRTIGLGRVSIVGHSFGCQIAADLAARRPEYIDHLVLIGPTVDPKWPTVLSQIPRWLLEAFRETLSIVPIVVRDYLRYGLRRFWRTAHAALKQDLIGLLPKVRAETLVLRGARDAFVSREWMVRMASLLPHAWTAEIPRAAHAVQLSAPDEVAALVRPFLRRIVSTRCPWHPDYGDAFNAYLAESRK